MRIYRRQPRPRRVGAAQPGRGIQPGRLVSNLLLSVGGLLLLAALLYASYTALTNWLMGQERTLRADIIAPLSLPTRTATLRPEPSPLPTALPEPSVAPSPTPSPTPMPSPTLPPAAPPVQIRIPAIGVKRSIIPLPRKQEQAGLWTWDTDRLFREGRPDLVGHWDSSANPGEPGNMVLVGHNFGYGFNGVFVSLGELEAGQEVIVVDKDGQTWTYRVTTVKRLKWSEKDMAELMEHLALLAPGGAERVTLVSCAGAEIEPFPERIYVVAEPVR